MMETKINLSLRNKTWFYSFTVDGKRHRGTTGTRDRAKALLAAERVLKQTIKGTEPFQPERETAATLFDKYISRKKADGLNPSTEKNYRNYAAKFQEFFPVNIKLSVLAADDMEEWKAALLETKVRCWDMGNRNLSSRFKGKGKPPKKELNRKAKNKQVSINANGKTLSKKTVKECLMFVGSVCRYFDLPSPLKRVKLPSESAIEKQRKLKHYDKAQLRLLLDTAKKYNKEFFWWLVFLSYSGCRLGEVQGIREKDINWEECSVFVVSSKRQTGRTLYLPPPQTSELIESGEEQTITKSQESPLFALSVLVNYAKNYYGKSYSVDKPLYYYYQGWIRKRLIQCAKIAKLPELNPHALRHTFISIALSDGYDLAAIAKYAGHKSVATTYETYAHLSKDIKIKIDV